MAVMACDFHSERSVKARVGRALAGIWLLALKLLTFSLLLGGLTLVFVGFSIGWALMGFAALPAMLIEWYQGDLKSLKVEKGSESVDGLLESDILALLPEQASPKQVAEIVGRVKSGQFMAARMGVTANLLINIASEDPKMLDDLWEKAQQTRQQTGSSVIHGGVLAAALLKQYPQSDMLLAQMHIELDDVIEGIRWYDRIRSLMHAQSKPRRTGGIARDWSFGYIPLLKKFGLNLSESAGRGGFSVDLPAHEKAIDQLLDTLGSAGRQNVALVGPTGVGKTSIIHAFAERLMDASSPIPSNLKFRQVFLLDSSALISAAPGRGELEGLVMRVLTEAYRAKNVIICLDNAQLFFEEGVGSVDLTNVLLPILEAGNLRVILTMDEQRLLQIGQRNPGLINALNRIVISPANYEETLQVMQNQLIMTEYKRKVTYMYQALAESYRLSERYVHDLEMPGRAIKLLESAASYSEGGLITINSVQQAIEQTLDVKVSVATDASDREMLLSLEDKIHERMINQVRAVQVVSDALRRARAGVRNPDRPIGTFLFLGPTGVGKTELAKALADVYFGGEDKIVRLDLNEYVGLDDVARLIADGASDPNSLTARVMKQPFSVVLLDEIEKAHPNVLTTLLQLLDEGILRDINNREVSFRDAIVIATSNAGADRIRKHIEAGEQLEQFEDQITDELISSNQFKPEFLNRFDEIVLFRPLDKPELLQVIDLILNGVNKTLALQKVQVSVSEDAKRLLVERGYDPRLGARPMRRVVQRAVENTVAKEMLSGNVLPGSTIEVTLQQVEQALGSASVPTAPDARDGSI
ncbi:ATP-dependent Clp protease ATP-binding subunit [Candidatus Saccharibacteria bacterium]|jgi:ATP-dependent Clp protease ATP-binding subunit ClpC|nr:ATP-dependent Clp protease ATP-binding subunit [Candidatus Saccharibacteria bacterium]